MTQLLSLVCCLGLPHPSIPPQTLLLYCNMVYRQACECLTHSWEVYLKINKNYNNPTLHHKKKPTISSTLGTKNQRTYLELQGKLSDNMPTSAQAEAETIFS